MIKFKVLAIKTEIDNMYTIFLLKKNMWADIIKTILEYPPIVAPDTLKEWKVAITSVEQGYEFIESQHNYKTGMGITFGGQGIPMDIGKSWDNFDENRKPRCFNCNIYGHIAKEYRKPKKDKKIRKYYKYNKVRHIAKDCRFKQKMKIRRNQEKSNESDEEENDKKKSFVKGLE